MAPARSDGPRSTPGCGRAERRSDEEGETPRALAGSVIGREFQFGTRIDLAFSIPSCTMVLGYRITVSAPFSDRRCSG